MADQAGDLLTVMQVAKRLKMNPETIRRLLREGHLKGIRFGYRAGWRVQEEDLQAYIEEKKRETLARWDG